jgi:multidrug efflux pump subunit AcrA (membrane-fusion protein)
MLRKNLLPIIALAGLSFAIFSVVRGGKAVPAAAPVAPPPEPPFEAYVAGAGIVEANTENIAIGTPVGNVVNEVYVKVGDAVKTGDALFKLRDQVTRAELEARKAAQIAAEAKLERLRSLPRPEDVPLAEARVEEARAQLGEQKNTLALWESVEDRRALSQEELSRKRFGVQVAEAKLKAAQAELDVLKAGAWKPDLRIAEAEVESARAAVLETEAELERRTIRATVDGHVLQVKVRPGEYAQPGPLETPLMMIGNIDSVFVRVDVDEHDAWRLRPGARAEASLRGNARMRTGLEFVRIEPYIVPKRSLTGESTERVDTRVLQVLYRFPKDRLPVYVGQQMDVFIEAAPLESASAEETAAGPSAGGE